MNYHAAFSAAICATPADDLPRLVYADWLDEHGDPARAEFIRVQCELATLPDPLDSPNYVGRTLATTVAVRYAAREKLDPDADRRGTLRRRERELLTANERDWTPAGVYDATGYQRRSLPFNQHWQFRRGFVAELTLSAADFLPHGPALFAACPLERLTLTDCQQVDAAFSPTAAVSLLQLGDRAGHYLLLQHPGLMSAGRQACLGPVGRLDVRGVSVQVLDFEIAGSVPPRADMTITVRLGDRLAPSTDD